MEYDVIEYLEQKARSMDIDVIWTDELSPYTPPTCSFITRRVLMNNRWHNPANIPFQFAHEISHISNGDLEDLCFYNSTFTGKSSVEYKANVGAVKLLVPFYCEDVDSESVNVCDFENNYCIPSYLDNVVKEQINEYYTKSKD